MELSTRSDGARGLTSRPERSSCSPATQEVAKEEAEIEEDHDHPVDEFEIWMEHKASQMYFSEICFARDGGFSDVHKLWGNMRYVWAAMGLVILGLNMQVLIYVNLEILINVTWLKETDTTQFLITNLFVQTVSRILFAKDKQVAPVALVAILEVSLGAFFLVQLMRMLWRVVSIKERSDFADMRRYRAISTLFWEVLPKLSNLSALKLLNYSTPSVLIPGFMLTLTRLGIFGGKAPWWTLPRFLVTRLLAGVIGFDAFLVKFRVAAALYAGPNVPPNQVCLGLFVFLNQMLGVVQVGWFVRERLFIFIFGGEEGTMSFREKMVQETWHAMLAKKVWEIHRPWPKALAIMLSYGDNDFQQLVLNTRNPTTPPNIPGPGSP